MSMDFAYTNGVIAAKEKALLGDTLYRLCEADAISAFRLLCERGFGGGIETTTDVHGYEKLLEKEEASIVEFIRRYAPSKAELAFFLAPNYFHNAKALLKAKHLGNDTEKMLSCEGLIPIEKLRASIEKGVFTSLENEHLKEALTQATKAFGEDGVSGAQIGNIFEEQLRLYLLSACKKNKTLKKLLADKTDMQNILICFRAQDEEEAKAHFLSGGNLSKTSLSKLFMPDYDKVVSAFFGTDWQDFVRLCIEEKQTGKPLVKAERKLAGYEMDYFYARRFDLQRAEPFLYYVSRRKTEAANVRIVLACLLAGFDEKEIKKRLRGSL